MNRFNPLFSLFYLLIFASQPVSANFEQRPEVTKFIEEMVAEHNFDALSLSESFSRVKLSKSIVEAISRPAEAKPWYKYRPIFLTKDRIKLGVKFLHDNKKTLLRAEQVYGVPAAIITAIIGVETRYGKHAGRYKVINSLSTLAFNYPKRSKFFRSELKHFFLLAREQKMEPHTVLGSYAGAMGIPQFISSSYRNYAIDFDGDDFIDIWNNPVDAIGSVANYFKVHGWQAGKAVAVRATVENDKYLAALSKGLEPHLAVSELGNYGIMAKQMLPDDAQIKLLEYEQKNGREFWLGFDNFYVITRYNHSTLYAMAVYQLAEEIRILYEAKRKD
jgi:membrane-bound lytic murein transglycosylase B